MNGYGLDVAKAAGCHTVNTSRHHPHHGYDAGARGKLVFLSMLN